MREHKYQLWDKEENKMYQCVTIACTNKNKWSPLIYTSDHIINGIDHDNYELLEYIGIKDKNETEIYEGYIIIIHYGNNEKTVKYLVKYCEDCGYYMLESVIDKYDLDTFCGYDTNQLEIVGNKFENPELLEKQPCIYS